jgi:hypothetical protein
VSRSRHKCAECRGSQLGWVAAFAEVHPDARAFVDSTAAMRVNAFLAGYVKRDALEAELARLELPAASRERLLRELRG